MDINFDSKDIGSKESINFNELEDMSIALASLCEQEDINNTPEVKEEKTKTDFDPSLKIEDFNIENITPKTGNYLGLDISKDSTGYCLVHDGIKETGNITLTKEAEELGSSAKSCHLEVLLRRALKQHLLPLVKGTEFEVIVIEDAYSGENPRVTRLLYSLNTAIDELLLDGLCTCKTFIRTSNRTWKSWLWGKCDPQKNFKGLNDKLRIQKCLEVLDVVETGTGFQDRLDATGILYGYLMCRFDEDISIDKPKKLTWSQIGYDFTLDYSYLIENNPKVAYLEQRFVSTKKLTKKLILEELTKTPDMLVLFDDVVPGFLDMNLGSISSVDGQGLFACWVKKNLKKRGSK